MRTKYVLGFMFNEDMTKVALKITNNTLDGVRAEINNNGDDMDVSAFHCMIKAFKEQTNTKFFDWNKFAVLVAKEYKVYVFFCSTPIAYHVEGMELIEVDKLRGIKSKEPNIDWLVSLAISGKPSLVTAEFY